MSRSLSDRQQEFGSADSSRTGALQSSIHYTREGIFRERLALSAIA
jgi:hypothetical protein